MEALGSFRTNSSVRVGDRRFIIERRLGNGAFGVVYKVKEESSHRAYALKEVLCLDIKAINNALREIETMSRISHENVIAIKDSANVRDDQGLRILILTEYCCGGNLNERLTRSSSEELNFKWIRQTAGALAFLHSCNVVHRDLKADNVLLTATEDAKLADFGLGREFMSVKRYPNNSEEYYMSSGVGPRHWVAPEFFRGHYTEKADVFSLGTLFYGILERDYIEIRGKVYYGAFKNIPDVGKVGLGEAMARYDPNISIKFSSGAQGSYALQRIALDAMQYSMNDRPSVTEIHNQIVSIGLQKSCQRSSSLAPTSPHFLIIPMLGLLLLLSFMLSTELQRLFFSLSDQRLFFSLIDKLLILFVHLSAKLLILFVSLCAKLLILFVSLCAKLLIFLVSFEPNSQHFPSPFCECLQILLVLFWFGLLIFSAFLLAKLNRSLSRSN